MRIKRCMALMLALLMLFSETATAFAADVSGNVEVPFSVSEEAYSDVSENETVAEAEEVVLEDVSEDSILEEDYSDSEEPTITRIDIEREPYRHEFYYGLERISNYSFQGMQFKLQMSDGKSVIKNVNRNYYGDNYGYDFFSYQIIDNLTNEPITADIRESYPVGKYTVKFTIEGQSTAEHEIEIVSVDKMPSIEYGKDNSIRICSEAFEEGNDVIKLSEYAKVDVSAGESVRVNFVKAGEYNGSHFTGSIYPKYRSCDVSGGDPNDTYWNFMYDTEYSGSDSIVLSSDVDRTYYLEFYPQCDVDIYAEKVDPIESISIDTIPGEDRFYEGFSNRYSMNPCGAKLKLTFKDKALPDKLIGFGEFGKYGIIWDIRDLNGDSVGDRNHNGFWGLEAGKYNICFYTGSSSVKPVSYEVTVKGFDEIPELKKDKSVQDVRSSGTFGDFWGTFADPVYYMDIDETGEYMLSTKNCHSFADIYDSEGNKIYDNSTSYMSHYFDINSTGRYYVRITIQSDTTEISFGEAFHPVSIENMSKPEKTEFLYGFDNNFTYQGLSLRIKYSDGSYSDTYKSDDLYKVFVIDRCTESGTSAYDSILDAYGNYPIGKYYWKFSVSGSPDVFFTSSFEVVPIKTDYTLVNGKPLSLKCNVIKKETGYGYSYMIKDYETGEEATPYYIGVNLIKGETYHFSIDHEYGEVRFYTPEINEKVSLYSDNKGFNYTAQSTGTHYLKVFTSGGSLSVSNSDAIKSVTVLSSQYQIYEYAGVRIDNESVNTSPVGIELLVEFENGAQIECAYGDEFWNSYGFKVEVPCDSEGNSIGKYLEEYKYWGCILEAGTDYYFRIKIPGYDGPIYDESKLSFKALDKSYFTFNGKKELNLTEDGLLQGAGTYFVNVEAGKSYRFITTVKSGINIFTDKYSSFYLHDGHIPFNYTATENKTLQIRVNYSDSDVYTDKPYISMVETEDMTSLSVITPPTKTEFEYGRVWPNPEGVVLKAGDTEIGPDKFGEYGIVIDIYNSDDKYVVRDKNGYIPIGKDYYFVYYVFGSGIELSDKAHRFDVIKADKSYQVVFVANYPPGFIDSPQKTQTIDTNKWVSLKANTFACKGYEFLGWAYTPDGDPEFDDKQKVCNISGEDESVTLYARWERAEYAITWNLSGGTFKNEFKPAGSYMVDSGNIILPSKNDLEAIDGFTFAGWYTDSEFKHEAKDIETGSTGDRTFYAKWSPKTFTISFNANTAQGEMQDQTVRYGVDEILTGNKFRSTGAFMGWALSPDGDVIYANKAKINIQDVLDYVIEDTLTLYAVWGFGFTIHAELGSSDAYYKDGEDMHSSYTYGTAYTLPKPLRTGWIFLGWYTEADYKNKITKITNKTTGDLHIYAKWSPVVSTIKFDANGGSGKMQKYNVNYDESFALPECGFTKKGYYFAGWVDSENKRTAASFSRPEEFEQYKSETTVYDPSYNYLNKADTKKTITFAAAWVKQRFTLSFETFGGNEIEDLPYYYNEAYDMPADPVKEGLEFAGWYLDAEYKKKVTKIKGLSGSVTLYAKWKGKYAVVFYPNSEDFTGSMDWVEISFGKATALPKNKFVRPGYAFMGWAEDPAALEPNYADKGKIFKNELSLQTLNLYAVWKKDFSILYETGGGTLVDVSDSVTYTYGDEFNLPIPIRTGYEFKGWYTDYSYKKQVKKITKDTYGDMFFVAKWQGLKYTVTFDANAPEGTKVKGKTKKLTPNYGTGKALTKNGFKISGYVFKGWALSEDGPVVFTNGQVISDHNDEFLGIAKIGVYKQNYILYAVWEPEIYTVKYVMNGIVNDETDTYTVEDSYTLIAPERIGYTFLGFYTDKKLKKKAKDLKAGTTGNKTFYAKWKAND